MNKYGVKCPRCKSQKVWKMGFVPTVKGRRDKFKCTMCGYGFHTGQKGVFVKRRAVSIRPSGFVDE